MGILERISTIMKANINDLLDRAEDPEIMLDQYIRDLESGVAEKLARDAKVLQIYEGPQYVQKTVIADTAVRRSRVGKS